MNLAANNLIQGTRAEFNRMDRENVVDKQDRLHSNNSSMVDQNIFDSNDDTPVPHKRFFTTTNEGFIENNN